MNYTSYILEKVASLNPVHAKKLQRNFASFDERHKKLSSEFYNKYVAFLKEKGKTIDFAIDSYLSMIADMNIEAVEFYRTGKYSSTTFDEVNQRVYANPEVMEYYMHGLILSQFLWKHHYGILIFFIDTLPDFAVNTNYYLEIGAGHGLYLSKALEILNEASFTVVDVSETSIDVARRFHHDVRVEFNIQDILNFESAQKFDFITMGEVLEHVEQPLKLLQKLHNILSDNGTLFLSTPTNAPTIDHIYLFNSLDEIREMINLAGFSIESEKYFLSEEMSMERAEKLKITILYSAFLKKKLAE